MMFPGFHARERPDHPAVVMAGSGDDRDLPRARRALEPARPPLARAGPATRRPRRHPARQPPGLVRRRVGGAALGALLHAGQLAPHRRRGRLHRQRLRRPLGRRVARRWPTGRPSSTSRSRSCSTATSTAGSRYEDAVADQPTTPLDEEPEGAGMFYSSGTTGRPKGILFPLPDRTVHDEHPLIAVKSPIANGPDDVYLSPAPLYHTAPVVTCSLVHRVGRHHGGDGAVGSRGLPGGHRALPLRPPRSSCRRCSSASSSSRRRCGRATTSRRCGWSPTPPRRARSRSSAR